VQACGLGVDLGQAPADPHQPALPGLLLAEESLSFPR